jgi:probable phosphoglycerate mutase
VAGTWPSLGRCRQAVKPGPAVATIVSQDASDSRSLVGGRIGRNSAGIRTPNDLKFHPLETAGQGFAGRRELPVRESTRRPRFFTPRSDQRLVRDASTERQNMQETTRICLVRHGETTWNAEKRIQGQIDIGLNAAGLAQAQAAAEWLAVGSGGSAVQQRPSARAPDRRAHRAQDATPARFAARISRTTLWLFRRADLRRITRPVSGRLHAFETREPNFVIPFGGESLQQLHARVSGGLRELAAEHAGETIIVVTHGGVLDIVNRLVRGNPLSGAARFPDPERRHQLAARPRRNMDPGELGPDRPLWPASDSTNCPNQGTALAARAERRRAHHPRVPAAAGQPSPCRHSACPTRRRRPARFPDDR